MPSHMAIVLPCITLVHGHLELARFRRGRRSVSQKAGEFGYRCAVPTHHRLAPDIDGVS
jgi:hypothetical protein